MVDTNPGRAKMTAMAKPLRIQRAHARYPIPARDTGSRQMCRNSRRRSDVLAPVAARLARFPI